MGGLEASCFLMGWRCLVSSVAILGLLSRQLALERVGSIYQGHEKHGVQKAEADGWT